MNTEKKQYRCKHCGKLFFKGDLVKGIVEVKCKNCKNFSTFEGEERELELSPELSPATE